MSPGCECENGCEASAAGNQFEFHTSGALLDASTWKPPGVRSPPRPPLWNEHVEQWGTKGRGSDRQSPRCISRCLVQTGIAASLSSGIWKYLSVGGTGGVGGVSFFFPPVGQRQIYSMCGELLSCLPGEAVKTETRSEISCGGENYSNICSGEGSGQLDDPTLCCSARPETWSHSLFVPHRSQK